MITIVNCKIYGQQISQHSTFVVVHLVTADDSDLSKELNVNSLFPGFLNYLLGPGVATSSRQILLKYKLPHNWVGMGPG